MIHGVMVKMETKRRYRVECSCGYSWEADDLQAADALAAAHIDGISAGRQPEA